MSGSPTKYHYDFGLRALKSVLVSAGNVKREHTKEELQKEGKEIDEESIAKNLPEQQVQSCQFYYLCIC